MVYKKTYYKCILNPYQSWKKNGKVIGPYYIAVDNGDTNKRLVLL